MDVPAKINLYLHITGKRADGYHLLDSLIIFTDICDGIEIERSDECTLAISGEFAHLVENNDQNIVIRAANLMAQHATIPNNIAIKLIKNIPVGAGLGGGSADGAATIILLNDFWQCDLSKQELMEIGLKLGADVPIFLERKGAFISSIGDEIHPLEEFTTLYAIIIYPHKGLSTKDVFKGFNIESARHLNKNNLKPTALRLLIKEEGLIKFVQNRYNDLESPATNLLPEIKDIINQLDKLEGCEFARMSGSGSACFAIFNDDTQLEANLLKLRTIYPDYWIKTCSLKTSY